MVLCACYLYLNTCIVEFLHEFNKKRMNKLEVAFNDHNLSNHSVYHTKPHLLLLYHGLFIPIPTLETVITMFGSWKNLLAIHSKVYDQIRNKSVEISLQALFPALKSTTFYTINPLYTILEMKMDHREWFSKTHSMPHSIVHPNVITEENYERKIYGCVVLV